MVNLFEMHELTIHEIVPEIICALNEEYEAGMPPDISLIKFYIPMSSWIDDFPYNDVKQ